MADDFGGLQTPLFDPKNKEQWAAYRHQAQDATRGINRMPHVFGGSTGYSDLGSLNSSTPMTPIDVENYFYHPRGTNIVGGTGSTDLRVPGGQNIPGATDLNSLIAMLMSGPFGFAASKFGPQANNATGTPSALLRNNA
jgi:hypothetical protein